MTIRALGFLAALALLTVPLLSPLTQLAISYPERLVPMRSGTATVPRSESYGSSTTEDGLLSDGKFLFATNQRGRRNWLGLGLGATEVPQPRRLSLLTLLSLSGPRPVIAPRERPQGK